MNYIESSIFNLVHYCTKGHPFRHGEKAKTVFYWYPELYVIIQLAFIGGFIDAVGYYKFGGLFTSSITGNLVAACASIYLTHGVLARALVTIAFLVSGIFGFFPASLLKARNEWNIKPISLLLYASEIICILVTFAVGLKYDQEIESNGQDLSDWQLMTAAVIMGCSVGVHNAAAKESIPTVPATTVMTMTLVSESAAIAQMIAVYLAEHSCIRLHHKTEPLTEQEKAKLYTKLNDAIARWVVVTRPLIAFTAGALVGVALAHSITYYCLFLPVFLLSTVLIDIYLAWLVDRKEASLKRSDDGDSEPAISMKELPQDEPEEEEGKQVLKNVTLADILADEEIKLDDTEGTKESRV
jgi:uncharacterized membrane protein YoaK (UPF0700 family)